MFDHLYFYLGLWLGKLARALAVFSRRGAGGTWPGHLALRVATRNLSLLEARLRMGTILVSGTNGKTTTAALIKTILERSGEHVVHNPSGANLLNGLTSALINEADFFGRIEADAAVLEVDEGDLPYALAAFTPEILVLLNLSRDQLDRYGEIDLTLERWLTAIRKLPKTTRLVICGSEPVFQPLIGTLQADGYPLTFFSLTVPSGYSSPLPGRFNQLNTNAAAAAALGWGVPAGVISQGLAEFRPVFGRGEEFAIGAKRVRILLAKNPASFDENLRLIREALPEDLSGAVHYPPLVLVLNDNIPDGRDISWIYDVNFEAHRDWLNRCPLLVSGRRAYDLALRLKYAGLNVPDSVHRLNPQLPRLLKEALYLTRDKETLYLLPTYSAMLSARKILVGKAIG